MSRRPRFEPQTAAFLARVKTDPTTATEVIEGARDLYAACQRLRKAALPREALQIVGELEAQTIQFGTWLRQFLPDEVKL